MSLRRVFENLPLALTVAFVAAYTTACCCCPVPSTSGVGMLREGAPSELAPTFTAQTSPAQAH